MLNCSGFVKLPTHFSGGFDHADVHLESGSVFVAHTANDTIEVIDGEKLSHSLTIKGCPEASGVLCTQKVGLVFAAARGAGKVCCWDATKRTLIGEIQVGPKPNGLAWDSQLEHLLVADVEDFEVRLVNPFSMKMLRSQKLPGRPRWCAYDSKTRHFLVNIRDPAGVALLDSETMQKVSFIRVSSKGPHGLDLGPKENLTFAACDSGTVVFLDLLSGEESASVPISGAPDVIWYNEPCELLYCAIANPGVIDVIDTRSRIVKETVKTEVGAHSFAFDRERQRLYVLYPKSCQAAVYEES